MEIHYDYDTKYITINEISISYIGNRYQWSLNLKVEQKISLNNLLH